MKTLINFSIRKIIFLLALFAIAAVIFFSLTKQKLQMVQTTFDNNGQPVQAKIPDEALKNALNLFSQAKSKGQNLSSGPCLGKVSEDWVLDIAHNPRQDVDNKKENQCEDFRLGRVHHFIELDENGKLINAY